MTRRLILASSSPRRQELIGRLGVDFEVRPPVGVDESVVQAGAFETSLRLAQIKARAVLREMTVPTLRRVGMRQALKERTTASEVMRVT